jgi:SAM-dependent methyltransferase
MLKILKKNNLIWKVFSLFLRINYSFFWKIRKIEKYKKENYSKTYFEDRVFLKFFKKKNKLRILELGCGIGLRLFNLKKNKPKFEIEGIDLSKKSIFSAQKHNNAINANIKFRNADIANFKLVKDIDYLISSFTLIYIKKKKLIKFLDLNKTKIKKGFIFLEYNSSNKSKNLSYYVHDFKSIIKESKMNDFKVEFKKIKYKRWIKLDHQAYQIIGIKNENKNN